MISRIGISAILMMMVACVPKPWVYDVTNTEFSRSTGGYSTFTAVYDGLEVTLDVTSIRAGLIRVSMKLMNQQYEELTYDFSAVRLDGDGLPYSLSAPAAYCCDADEWHKCTVGKNRKISCVLFFDHSGVGSPCKAVEIELGTASVTGTGTRLEIGTVTAVLAGKADR